MTNDTNATAVTRRVPISAVKRDPAFQVRVRGVHFGTMQRYATALRGNPEALPPITLAQVGRHLLLVDGWHRLAAHQSAGIKHIRASIIPATREEAFWLAGAANLRNSRPLSRADLLQAFRMYITARRHRTEDNGFKSYREIAADFANVKSYTTIRNWMERLYPGIFRAMRNSGMDEDPGSPERRRTDDRARLNAAVEALRIAQEHVAALGPPRNRPELVAGLADLAREAGLPDSWTLGDADPF